MEKGPFLPITPGDVAREQVQRVHVLGLIRSFAKKGVSEEVLKKYSIEARTGNIGFDRESRSSIYRDTQFGLELTYENRPVALVSYEPIESGILIRQLQAAKKANEKLDALRWELLLVTAVKELARRMPGCREVRLIKGEEVRYDGPEWTGGRTEEQFRGDMEKRYDITAKRSGFTWDENSRRWVYKLEGS